MSDSQKLPNVSEHTQAVSCESRKHCSLEKLYKHRLTVTSDSNIMDAMVLHNNICVLMSKTPLNALKVSFADNMCTENVSGKLKKGAQTIKAGCTICSVVIDGGDVVQLKTLVGGKLLEMNEALLANPTLLNTHHNSTGFVAIVYPDTEIPTLDAGGCSNWSSLVERIQAKRTKSKADRDVCFAFLKGNCTRGDTCKFGHIANDAVQ